MFNFVIIGVLRDIHAGLLAFLDTREKEFGEISYDGLLFSLKSYTG